MDNHKRMLERETSAVLKEAKKRFLYDEKTGNLLCKIKCGTRKNPGDIAGGRQGRYMRVTINNMSFPLHRIIWALYYGSFAPQIIDHIDGNPFNNKIDNLRLTDIYHNGLNRHKPSPINTFGFKNISLVDSLEKRLTPPKVYSRWSVTLFTQRKKPLQKRFKRLKHALEYRNKMLKQMGLPYKNIDDIQW